MKKKHFVLQPYWHGACSVINLSECLGVFLYSGGGHDQRVLSLHAHQISEEDRFAAPKTFQKAVETNQPTCDQLDRADQIIVVS